MKQLTLQFEGYADETRQPLDVKAPVRKAVQVVNRKAAHTKSAAYGLTARVQQMISPWHAAWQAWALKRNDTFTKLCGSEGETFRNIEVVRAHLYCLFVLFISALIGG